MTAVKAGRRKGGVRGVEGSETCPTACSGKKVHEPACESSI